MTTTYHKRDYAFGAEMLTLRTAIGLTQARLADLLGISRRAVGEWEAGKSYPKAAHLKQMIALAVKQQAFPVGSEVPEIRKLWKVARQKVLLDERWLSALLDCSTERTTSSDRSCVRAEEGNGMVETQIYPTDWGRFALGSPSGTVLYPGQMAAIELSGHRIAGIIRAGSPDYFQAENGMGCCGLCAGMRVIVPMAAIVPASVWQEAQV